MRTRMENLAEVAAYFTQLGCTAFGGPTAHIALMQRQLVEQRRWLNRQHFLDLLAAVTVLPGPNSTQMALALGYLRAGPLGLLAAGICFITPAVLIILPLAWAYMLYGQTPHAAAAMRCVNAALLAVIASATVTLGRTAIRDSHTTTVAICAAVAATAGRLNHWPMTDLLILISAAIVGSLGSRRVAPVVLYMQVFVVIPQKLAQWCLAFLKIGATLYGSGYLLLPYLQSNFIDAHAWLTQRQLLDAVAVGQVTPGPLLTTSTFIGFVLGWENGLGLRSAIPSALACTMAIFAPSFLFVALLGKVLPRLWQSPTVRSALQSMRAAVASLIAVSLVFMAIPEFSGAGVTANAVIAIATLVVLLKWNVNPTWPILAAAGVGICQAVFTA